MENGDRAIKTWLIRQPQAEFVKDAPNIYGAEVCC